MIRIIPATDTATQLARYCFARMLAGITRMELARVNLPGCECPGVSGRKVLWPEWVVDGEFPRVVHLNLPWDHWQDATTLRCGVAIGGSFRRSDLFASRRVEIRDSWLQIRKEWAGPGPAEPWEVTVVCRTWRNRVRAFPTPADTAAWTRGVRSERVSVLLPYDADVKAYQQYGFSASICSDEQRLRLARAARRILTADFPLGWWCSFLSQAERVVTIRNRRDERR